MDRSLVDVMRKAMLPLDGSIADHVPDIVTAYAQVVPPPDWSRITAIDFTAGSCLLPLLLAAQGIGRLVVNDIAARSYLAAKALFGRCSLDAGRVQSLVTAKMPRLQRHTPTFHFASDYLTREVAETFDRLFHARVSTGERPIYQYLALRWVLGFVPSPEQEFAILPCHNYGQLARDGEHDWAPYIRRVRRKRSVLAALVANLNTARHRLTTRKIEIHQADLLQLCRQVDYGRQAFAMINPPTRGIDEYVIDDQLAHSLLANRWLPLSRSRESAVQFWTRRVQAALSHLPVGSHAVVWGGDGVLSLEQCLQVWKRYGDLIVLRRVGRGHRSPGWAILEKRSQCRRRS